MSNNLIVNITEEGNHYDKSKYFSDRQILNHDYQDKLTNIFINSHCYLNGGERTNLADNIDQVRKIFSEHTDNNIKSVWIGVFDIGKLDTDEFKKRGIQEGYWKNSIHVQFGGVQDKVLVYSWLDVNQFSQDQWNNFLLQLEGDHKVSFIGTGPLTFKYKDFNYRVYPPLFVSSDDKKSFLNNPEVYNFSPTEISQIIEDIKESHQSIEKKIINHYELLGKSFANNNKGYIEIKAGIGENNVKNFTDVSYTNGSDGIDNNPIKEAFIKEEELHNAGGLHGAVYMNNESILKKLLEIPSYDVNAVNANGKTPLHLAAKYGRKDMVEMLLNKGAKVDIADSRGRTPLHLAAVNGHKDVVEALLKANGINVNAVDEDGKTAFDLATDDKIKTLLQPTEKSNPVDESLKDSEGVQEEEEEEEEEDVAPTEPAQPVAPQEPAQPVSTEPAQTEEQPSSFFGSLFSILMKPFSLIASFFGGFFSWLFGSDEPTQSPPESDQQVVSEPPNNQVSDEPTQSLPESDQAVVSEPPNNQVDNDII